MAKIGNRFRNFSLPAQQLNAKSDGKRSIIPKVYQLLGQKNKMSRYMIYINLYEENGA